MVTQFLFKSEFPGCSFLKFFIFLLDKENNSKNKVRKLEGVVCSVSASFLFSNSRWDPADEKLRCFESGQRCVSVPPYEEITSLYVWPVCVGIHTYMPGSHCIPQQIFSLQYHRLS